MHKYLFLLISLIGVVGSLQAAHSNGSGSGESTTAAASMKVAHTAIASMTAAASCKPEHTYEFYKSGPFPETYTVYDHLADHKAIRHDVVWWCASVHDLAAPGITDTEHHTDGPFTGCTKPPCSWLKDARPDLAAKAVANAEAILPVARPTASSPSAIAGRFQQSTVLAGTVLAGAIALGAAYKTGRLSWERK